MKAALGLDFGTESVRAGLVDLRGRELASAVAKNSHGQIIESLPGSQKKLPPRYAFQHPLDWLDSLLRPNMGIHKSQVSSLLVMAVLGGAILPPVQGAIADATKNLQISFIVPLLAHAYVGFYGWKGHRIGRAKSTVV